MRLVFWDHVAFVVSLEFYIVIIELRRRNSSRLFEVRDSDVVTLVSSFF